jgi:hypothetical protein
MTEFNERDLFAAFAMCGMVMHNGVKYGSRGELDDKLGVERAYDIADIMLIEKEKRDATTSD